jgi:hypothetical protein
MVCNFLADDTVRVRLIWLCKPTYSPDISFCLAAAWDSLDGWLADGHYEATEYAALCRMWQAMREDRSSERCWPFDTLPLPMHFRPNGPQTCSTGGRTANSTPPAVRKPRHARQHNVEDGQHKTNRRGTTVCAGFQYGSVLAPKSIVEPTPRAEAFVSTRTWLCRSSDEESSCYCGWRHWWTLPLPVHVGPRGTLPCCSCNKTAKQVQLVACYYCNHNTCFDCSWNCRNPACGCHDDCDAEKKACNDSSNCWREDHGGKDCSKELRVPSIPHGKGKNAGKGKGKEKCKRQW